MGFSLENTSLILETRLFLWMVLSVILSSFVVFSKSLSIDTSNAFAKNSHKKIGATDKLLYNYNANSYNINNVKTANPNSNVFTYNGISRSMYAQDNFVYDDHGRLVYDLSKGLQINYNHDHMAIAIYKGKGERNFTAKPDGTKNPFKHLKPHPTKPDKVNYKDPKTGKIYVKPKPPGFPN